MSISRSTSWLSWGSRLMLVVLYTAFLVDAVRHQATPLVDDAAINYRYVDQIAAGHGIVYNTGGPHVYGCSALPFTLVVALIYRCGVGLQRAKSPGNAGRSPGADPLRAGAVSRDNACLDHAGAGVRVSPAAVRALRLVL